MRKNNNNDNNGIGRTNRLGTRNKQNAKIINNQKQKQYI